MKNLLILIATGLFLTACGQPDTTLQDGWLGKWTGPEGTALMLSKDVKKGRYLVSIQSLDSLKTYIARPEGRGLEFKRDGIRETVLAGNGESTGMKWLADKKECLVIRSGEGFCRK